MEFLKEKLFIKWNMENKEDDIINEWKEQWNKESFNIKGVYEVGHPNEKSDCFIGWLIATMFFLKRRIKVNKVKNFVFKGLSLIIPLIMLGVSYLIQKKFSLVIIPEGDAMGKFENWIYFLGLVIVPSFIIKSWIDVKKYQETWARYTKTRSAVLCEMTKYIYKIDEYNSVLRKIIFIKKILVIVNANVEKFNDNMINKEKEVFRVSEIADLIKGK